MTVKEKLDAIKAYIAAKVFRREERYAEQFRNSLKAEPPNALAEASGEGKTEFAEDSLESEFEGAALPYGIEEELAKTDWSVYDVLVGSVRSLQQLKYCLETKHYYVPEKYISESNLPVKYIALYEDQIGTQPGIKYVGEVILSTKVKRKRIPLPSYSRPNAIYYYFKVRKWFKLPEIIAIQDTDRTPRFTNRFLLKHCRESYQLFHIRSEAEYRLLMALRAAFTKIAADASQTDEAVYKVDDFYSVGTSGKMLYVTDREGNKIAEVLAEQFAKSPKIAFLKVKKSLQKEQGNPDKKST